MRRDTCNRGERYSRHPASGLPGPRPLRRPATTYANPTALNRTRTHGGRVGACTNRAISMPESARAAMRRCSIASPTVSATGEADDVSPEWELADARARARALGRNWLGIDSRLERGIERRNPRVEAEPIHYERPPIGREGRGPRAGPSPGNAGGSARAARVPEPRDHVPALHTFAAADANPALFKCA